MAYAVSDLESFTASAVLGALQSRSNSHTRRLDVTVRVGDRSLDNYHVVDGRMPRFTSGGRVALEDEPNAIRQALWRETDRVYRLAAERLIQIRTEDAVSIQDEDAPADFSVEEPSVSISIPDPLQIDREAWTERLRALSAEFKSHQSVLRSGVSLEARREVKYFVDSEGARVTHGWTSARISINATAKAPDGMDLATTDSFEAITPAGLPDDKAVIAAIRKAADDLTKMVDAPQVAPYVAPAILSGRAAGVFFHEIFGHRVEGHRLKDVTEGQTFGSSLGDQVLPTFLSVIFDPTRKRFGGTDLMGWYEYDDDGVRARRVPVVENGILETFLMSRSPAPGLDASNGHGRRQPGREVVARQSNLIVESTKAVSDEKLREMLIEEIVRQGKEYGFFFEQVTGGFTLTGRRGIQAFKVIPLVVYRVYPDGRADELVRGADIVGTPLAAFSKIIAAGDTPGVFNGYCGAESGQVPVSAVSPALLVSEIEIQRKESSQDRPPLLPRPVLRTGARQ